MEWKVLCPASLLSLEKTLFSGQTFRWTLLDSVYISTFGSTIVGLKEDCNNVMYCNYNSKDDISFKLNEYFRLHKDMDQLYNVWAKDSHFKKTTGGKYNGIRMLDQDSIEVIFQFICSQNNNIKRIGSLVNKFTINFGSYVDKVGDCECYSFPTLEQLNSVKDLDYKLRELGFGYRAKYIAETAKHLHENPSLLDGIMRMDYENAKIELLQLSGVGPKVADCVLLFGFNKPRAIPVDTHVWQIAKRDYKMKIGDKMNLKVYSTISDGFFEIFGDYCGWAHTLLFVADLKGTTSIPLKRPVEIVADESIVVKEE